MNVAARVALYKKNVNRPSFRVLGVPLFLLLLSPLLGEWLHAEMLWGWSLVVCVFFSPLMGLHAIGASKAWEDFKHPGYPKELAMLALALNVVAPFLVIYFILYM